MNTQFTNSTSNFSTMSASYPSIRIPFIPFSMTEEELTSHLVYLGIGSVKSVTFKITTTKKGWQSKRAFIMMKEWFNNPASINIRTKLDNGNRAKLSYNDPKYFVLLKSQTYYPVEDDYTISEKIYDYSTVSGSDWSDSLNKTTTLYSDFGANFNEDNFGTESTSSNKDNTQLWDQNSWQMVNHDLYSMDVEDIEEGEIDDDIYNFEPDDQQVNDRIATTNYLCDNA